MGDIYYKTVNEVTSILVFVEGIKNAAYGELAEIEMPDGRKLTGQVLDTKDGFAVVQSFDNTTGMDTKKTAVRFLGNTAHIRASTDMFGRVFNGLGKPRDKGMEIYNGEEIDINGSAINPSARDNPAEFIQTGISAIDGMNTLVRGQKLPIFSAAGLPHNRIAAQIARQATLLRSDEPFSIVFGGIGINSEEANFFMDEFEKTGALERSIMFLNLASEPSMERLMLPRVALSTAEYLAYEEDMHVLVILTDMTNYCEALREVSAARNEVPGRRGYPSYMYTDLSTIYERAGRIIGKKGSITQLPILTMPDDDITHPIPDLTGYITEGQIVLDRKLYMKSIYPNINVLLSLSRLMNNGIGSGKTREDHRGVADQLFSAYANGIDIRSLTEIVGQEALNENDKKYLKFAELFEKEFVRQGYNENRDIDTTLDIAWRLLSNIDKSEIKRIKDEYIKKYGKWGNGTA